MNKALIAIVVILAAGVVSAQSFTDIDSPQYEGKTKVAKRSAAIDANFAQIEGGEVKTASIANGAGIHTQTVASASYTLEPSAVHTQTFAAASAATIVTIKNNAATNVVIDIAAGDTTLGDNDTIVIGYLGSEWIKIAGSDN